jgi:acyl carrier protein
VNTTEPTTIRTTARDTPPGTAAATPGTNGPAARPEAPAPDPGDAALLVEIAGLLAQILGISGLEPGAPVPGSGEPFGMATRMGDDLELESIDLVTLAGHLEERYGARVNLAEFLAGLDIDSIIALTVGDVVRHVRVSLGTSTPAED